jgi:hypothetical protein
MLCSFAAREPRFTKRLVSGTTSHIVRFASAEGNTPAGGPAAGFRAV